ncbi:MAG: hypothetical protein K6B41_11380 [Butyrivibrio sp.]|nr:hypothetical protein [Butyrivibrio sp.]
MQYSKVEDIKNYTDTKENIKKYSHAIWKLPWKALEYGVFADFFEVATKVDTRVCFTVFPEKEDLQELKSRPSMIEEMLQREKELLKDHINGRYQIKTLKEINDDTYFLTYNDLSRAVYDMAIMKRCFYKYGYEIPKIVSRKTIKDLYTCENKSQDKTLSTMVRLAYKEALEKTVDESYQFYQKYAKA